MEDLELKDRVVARLQRLTGGPVELLEFKPLFGGAVQDNYRVEFILPSGQRARLALRSDAEHSLPGSLDRGTEFALLRGLRRHGVMVPQVRWLSPGLVRSGSTAYFMSWLEGEAIGSRVTRHPKFKRARRVLPGQLAEQLGRIHAIDPQIGVTMPIERSPFGRTSDPALAALSFLTQMIDRLGRPRPARELILRWLREHRPVQDRITLVHGDFRTGNFMINASGLIGVLDWEFAHWGDPAEDLAWMCTRDWRFGKLHLEAGGLSTRDDLYAAYEQASKTAVDRHRVHWWEIYGNLRWAAGASLQGARYVPSVVDLELLAIPQRAPEMEYEALRLIDVGA